MASKFDRKEYYKQYYQEHKERMNANSTAWRLANPERTREIARKCYRNRKERKEREAKGETET